MHDLTTGPIRVIGCDVGKTTIVVFDSASGRISRVANDPAALAAFAAGLAAASPAAASPAAASSAAASLAICEATGGYEAALLAALVDAGFPVHRADARKVKAFIRSLGTLGKSDAIDAKALARYGQERHDRLVRWQPRQAVRDALQTLVATRKDLVRERVAFRNRLAAPGAAAVEVRLQRLVAALDAEIAGIEDDIDALLAQDTGLARAAATLRTITGIGATTAVALLALMPELGTLGRRQAAALAGLAPHPHQSGKLDAYRRVRGGRPDVKRAMFNAALAARRHDPTFRAFYERLIANGKKPLVAIVALMRKLIVVANAKLRDAQLAN